MNKEEKRAFKEVFHALSELLREFSLEDLESPYKAQVEAIKNGQAMLEKNKHFLTNGKVIIYDKNGKIIGRQG